MTATNPHGLVAMTDCRDAGVYSGSLNTWHVKECVQQCVTSLPIPTQYAISESLAMVQSMLGAHHSHHVDTYNG